VRAALCRQHGGPEAVRIEEIAPVPLGDGQVRVRVRAAAVNYPDVLLVANEYQIKVATPFTPGSEFAGVVIEVAEGVTEPSIGDRVFGTGLFGAFAEESVVAANSVQPTPDGVDDRAAAAFGVAHRTAYNVLRSVASVQRGEEVIVLGAAGGVGLAAVQLASLLGAPVTAVASSQEKLEVAATYGAHGLIDHRAGELRPALRTALPDGGDVVIDPVGGRLSEPALRALRWGGRFVTVGFASGEIPRIPLNLVLLKGVRILGFEFFSFATNAAEDLDRNEHELLELLATGRVTPHIGAAFRFDDVAAALRYVADGKAIGKVVLDVL
jgi:NADPH2:quinone reductase